MPEYQAHQRGREGELAARTWLEQRGWQLVVQNWSCPLGEIDLIMDEGETRVFVEV